MDLRVLIVLTPIVFSVAWTAYWLAKWGILKLDFLNGLNDAVDG